MTPEEELKDFSERLAEMPLDQARSTLKSYFREMLDSASVEEIREMKTAMLNEAGEGRERDFFESALDGYLAAREERN